MKKRLFRFISTLLCILMVAQCAPLGVFATEWRNSEEVEEENASVSQPSELGESQMPTEEIPEEPTILYELTEKREADTKHFLMSDHSIMAAKYEKSVHYKKDGAWQNIDLSVEESENDILMPENSFETKFSKKSNGKKLVTVTMDQYSLSWGLDDAEKVDAEYHSYDPEDTEDPSVLKNLEGNVIYREILPEVELEYVVSGDGIKENIVLLNDSAPTEYVFHYETSHLTPRVNEEGNIEFFDPENGEKAVFTLEKPVMFDCAKAFSENVEMTLTETGNGKFSLTLTPDENWLLSEERVWPVVIDPATFTSLIDANIWDIDMSNRYPNSAMNYLASDNVVGSNGSSEAWRALIWIQSLPEIGNATVLNATMRITNYPGRLDSGDSYIRPHPAGPIQVNAHRVTQAWPEKTATWNGYAHNYDSRVEDYFIYYGTENQFSIDLTELTHGWYQGTYPNYGIMIKSNDETATGQIMQFTSSDWATNSSTEAEYRPKLFINYRDETGLENYWSYTPQSHSEGTGYINNHNGNLTWVLPQVSFNSGVNGFTLSHIYNSTYSENDNCGTGWTLNLHQMVRSATLYNAENAVIAYIDGDGTKHFFVQKEDGSVVDEDGLGYTYTCDTTREYPHHLTNKDKSILKFDAHNYLRQIEDANGNKITITYEVYSYGNVITSITTSTGGEIKIEYNDGGLIYSTTDNAGRQTLYEYSGRLLTKIIKPDGSAITLEYVGEKLRKVVFPDGIHYLYNYDSRGRIYEVWQENTAQDYYRAWNTFAYDYNQTTVTFHDQAAIGGQTKYSLTYQFDSLGRNTSIYNSEDQSFFQNYTDNDKNSSTLDNNKPTLTANSVQYIDNHLNNASFSSGLDGWTILGSADLAYDQPYISSSSAKMSGTAEGYYVIMQTPRSEEGKTYTLSTYMKWENVVSSNGGGVGLEIVTNWNGSQYFYTTGFSTGTSDPAVENGFVRFEKTITLTPGETINRVTAGLYSATGTVWVNGIQLEEGDTANHVNLLSNSGFEQNSAGTTAPSYFGNVSAQYGALTAEDKKHGAVSYRIYGDADIHQDIFQTVNVSGKAGDVFSYGGWAKAEAAPKNDMNNACSFRFCVEIIGPAGSQWENLDLNMHVNDWQYATKTLVTNIDYTAIKLYLCYNNNVNTAYFDSVFLYRDTAQSYVYDKNGNVVSSRDNASQENNFTYNGKDLTKMLDPQGTGFEYFYDEKGNLLSSHSSEGFVNSLTYDSLGNPISSATFANDASASIQSGKTYYIQLKSTGEYLTVEGAGTASETNVIEAPFTGGAEQRWKIVSAPKGGYYLYPEHTANLALDLAAGVDADGANIFAYIQNGNDYQRFYILPQKDYTYQIQPAVSEGGRVLSVLYAGNVGYNNVSIISPQGELNPDQCFIIKEAQDPVPVEDGLYRIRMRHSGSYLDVAFGGNTEGTVIQQHATNDSNTQIFRLKRYGDTDTFSISPLCAPDKYLSVSWEKYLDAFWLIRLGDDSVGDWDRFVFQYDTTLKAYRILCYAQPTWGFTVIDGGTADGTQLIHYDEAIGAAGQGFVLEKVSQQITSSMTYDSVGNYPASLTDSRGNTTTYTYDTAKGLQTAVTDPKETVTSYSYNDLNDILQSVTTGNSTVSYQNSAGHLVGITSPSGTQYNFLYDSYYQTTATKVGEQSLSQNEYDYEGRLVKTTYGSGDTVEFIYDSLDRIKEKKYNGVVKEIYSYNKAGLLYKSEDLFAGTTTTYEYDLSGRVLGAKVSNGASLRYLYDSYNRISRISTTSPEGVSSVEYIYGNSSSGQKTGLIYGVKQGSTQTLSYTYDELCRLSSRTVGGFTTNYTYLQGASINQTTTLIETVKNGNTTLSYTYDEVGNITSVSKNGTLVESYEYDSLGQLIKVIKGQETWEYDYDAGGNITSVVKTDAYGTKTTEKEYRYGDLQWKDLLTVFNEGPIEFDSEGNITKGSPIVYDAIGNPIQYRDGMTFEWELGRRLSDVDKDGLSVDYTYNAEGLRLSKTVNGVVTTYHWLEGTLLGQTCGSDTILFLYDENGSTYGFIHNDAEQNTSNRYYYIFNLQGDVIGILNSSGEEIVSYEYDVWGEILSVKDASGTRITDPTHIGNLNPIRYRGYYYDAETGFYYLQSRYYDPVTCRFINADSTDVLTATPMGLTDKNLFAYCDNNPVMRYDDGGEFWAKLKSLGEKCLKVAAVTAVATLGIVAIGGAVTATVTSGGTAAGTLVLATQFAEVAFTAAGAMAISGITTMGIAEVGENITYAKDNSNSDVDPYARPGQKKQGRERKNKARKSKDWESRSKPKPPNKHTPGRDHRKYRRGRR